MNLFSLSSPQKGKSIGHLKEKKLLLSLYEKSKLAPCWIISGQKGIGKSTLAYYLAKQILAKNPQNIEGLSLSIVEHQINKGSYPNLLTIQCPIDEKEKIEKEIPISETRKLFNFLYQSPIIPGWRVVIIDAVDELNRFAANSILKILEEPPSKTFILLICHSLSRVLPTIRSRCQRLICQPLGKEDFYTLLNTSDYDDLLPYTSGSVGLLQSLIKAGGQEFIQALEETIRNVYKNNMQEVQKFCYEVSQQPEKFNCFLWLINQCIYKAFFKSFEIKKENLLYTYQRLIGFIAQAKGSHLDKNQFLRGCFLIIENPHC